MNQGLVRTLMALACAYGAGCQNGRLDTAASHDPVVYETDDRQDVYAFPDATWAARAVEVTVALMDANAVTPGPNGTAIIAGDTLAEAYGVCPGERFEDQITPGFCSGTLVAPDIVLTAGQCIPDQAACDNTRLVFDFHMLDANNAQVIDMADDVYSCAQVLAQRRDSSLDYALIELDRAVVGRTPAVVRRDESALAAGTSLHVNGHTSGLPLKIDDGATVRDGRAPARDYFVTEADTFAGSAGSGVFDAENGDLVGVMARGDTDFVTQGTCTRPQVCEAGACTGEDATYAFRALAALCGDGTCQAGLGEASTTCPEDCGGAVCADGVCNGGETPATCPADCPCGDGVCDGAGGENVANCEDDCAQYCGNETCETGYGEDAVNCSDCAPDCGDGVCAGSESSANCCIDCGCDSPNLERCLGAVCSPRGMLCADPGTIEVSAADVVQVFTGDTYTANANFVSTCAPGDSPERIYAFTLSGLTAIEATTTGFDTVLYVRRECADDDPDNQLACNDEADPPGDNGSYLRAELPAGTYYLIVDGYDGDSGAYQLSVSFELLCIDADGDLECNESDGCPDDPEKVVGGICGCGTPDTDTDGDDTADCQDLCPADPDKTVPQECGCGVLEGECSGCGCDLGRPASKSDLGGLLLALFMFGGLLLVRVRRRFGPITRGGVS